MKFSFPNESADYRQARNDLLEEEQELIAQVKRIAAKRRELPRGGKLKEMYTFSWATDDKLGNPVSFGDLFGDKDTLLLYSLMFAPGWDKPCPSCTSIVDGLDRMARQVSHDAAFVVVAKESPERINEWAHRRGWNQIDLISGHQCSFQADYGCQLGPDEKQYPMMNVFQRSNGEIYQFWAAEAETNNIDKIWPYWNLMDLTPAGRPDRPNPPAVFD